MDFEGRTIYGNAVNVAESMCSKEIINRYKYDEKKQNAMSFEEVIQRIIYFNRSKNIELAAYHKAINKDNYRGDGNND